jgi:hypothetical protein
MTIIMGTVVLYAAAREHFNPAGKPADPGAIQPADDGVRNEGA